MPRCSLQAKMTTSMMAMTRSWSGLVLPRTAPKEMSTTAAVNSAPIMLQGRDIHDCAASLEQGSLHYDSDLSSTSCTHSV